MVVGAVECRGFRNLSDARTELDTEIAVIWGPNGAGKTNLLEAVYFGFTGRSFRAGNDRDMIAFDEQSARWSWSWMGRAACWPPWIEPGSAVTPWAACRWPDGSASGHW